MKPRLHLVVQGEVGIIGEEGVRARVQTCLECEGMASPLLIKLQ